MTNDIINLLKAGFPAILYVTKEPLRIERMIVEKIGKTWNAYHWDINQGVKSLTKKINTDDSSRAPIEGINYLSTLFDSILIAHNLNYFTDQPMVFQAIQNNIPIWKSHGNCLIIVSTSEQLHPAIKPLFHLVTPELPDEEELYKLQLDLGVPLNIHPNRRAARIATGLTLEQAEAAFSLSLVERGYFSSRLIMEEKLQIVKKSGLLEVYPPVSINDVGGLNLLKDYVFNRRKAFEPSSNMPRLKGLILVGIPGTGKSLACRAVANVLKLPLIRFNLGNLKSGLVGESEHRLHEALKVISAFGSSVVMIDEIEKQFQGSIAGSTDGGVSAALLGEFLSWQQDQDQTLVIGTANGINNLPPEFIRSGRFDAIFYVDTPNLSERIQILRIMNRRYKTNIPDEVAEKLTGYTGAEIEQIVKDSVFDGLDQSISSVIPLCNTMKEEIERLKSWGKSRCRLANIPEKEQTKYVRSLKKFNIAKTIKQ